ncbi:MAG: NAD-dependent epimerase/dehydratase family protein [Actinobacteria bacterium]|nr:NAD-dependent epimerase/dehydratase family protein [Actinomycetota bacterium]
MRVLVSGGAGYIGSVLTGMLLEAGHDVVVLDRMFFGNTLTHLEGEAGLRVVRGDVRTVDAAVLDGVDAVLGLAAISNDPAGELDPEATRSINFAGRARMAGLARDAGVGRYVLASSCSVYGFQDGTLDEHSSTKPLTTYAEANIDAEVAILELSAPGFATTALRQATVYGLSSRMRFDLAINGMALGAIRDGAIPILRDGTQWRPMVHVRDTARAFMTVLEAPREAIDGQIFNVGSNDQNFQILPLARRVSEAAGVPFVDNWYGDPDHRSYQVSFDKIGSVLSYEPQLTPEDAAVEIRDALETGLVTPDARTRTVEWYRELLTWKDRLDSVVLDGKVL